MVLGLVLIIYFFMLNPMMMSYFVGKRFGTVVISVKHTRHCTAKMLKKLVKQVFSMEISYAEDCKQ